MTSSEQRVTSVLLVDPYENPFEKKVEDSLFNKPTSTAVVINEPVEVEKNEPTLFPSLGLSGQIGYEIGKKIGELWWHKDAIVLDRRDQLAFKEDKGLVKGTVDMIKYGAEEVAHGVADLASSAYETTANSLNGAAKYVGLKKDEGA
jgi:hypothetical protein